MANIKILAYFIYLFMVYLTTLLAAQSTQRGKIIEWLAAKMWKKADIV